MYVITEIIEVVSDFGKFFLFFGVGCAFISAIGAYSSMRTRWRNRRHYSDDYSGYLWPGEGRAERYLRSIIGTTGYLMVMTIGFALTVAAASVAAAALALAFLGSDLVLCTVIFLLAIIISGIAGTFSQYFSDLLESSLLGYAESLAGVCRPRFHYPTSR